MDLLDGFKFDLTIYKKKKKKKKIDLTQSGLDIGTLTGLIEVRANQAQVYMNANKA
jgi:hypothetical protein